MIYTAAGLCEKGNGNVETTTSGCGNQWLISNLGESAQLQAYKYSIRKLKQDL